MTRLTTCILTIIIYEILSSVLYEAGYLREYNSFRNVLTYMFTVPLDAKQATFMFRASKSPDSCDNRKVQMYVKYVLLLAVKFLLTIKFHK
jgi:hypothetical protein